MSGDKPIVIFDIDGTLADNSHRQHLVTNGKMLWGKFFEEMGNDTPVQPLVTLCNVLFQSGQYEIRLFTGRPEKYRKITEQWLAWNGIPDLPVTMRADGDTRPDSGVKQDMLNGLMEKGRNISFVIDDRQSVVDMWRKNGILCLQCAPHDF